MKQAPRENLLASNRRSIEQREKFASSKRSGFFQKNQDLFAFKLRKNLLKKRRTQFRGMFFTLNVCTRKTSVEKIRANLPENCFQLENMWRRHNVFNRESRA
jgi:hypothetical protein